MNDGLLKVGRVYKSMDKREKRNNRYIRITEVHPEDDIVEAYVDGISFMSSTDHGKKVQIFVRRLMKKHLYQLVQG